ncbi:hypothetical protein PDN92_29905, partial [Escherichia coli]|uniref:hypothetical protein n=1 Tax=Escherichia coli TaxID=562 RepID=UPI0022F28077
VTGPIGPAGSGATGVAGPTGPTGPAFTFEEVIGFGVISSVTASNGIKGYKSLGYTANALSWRVVSTMTGSCDIDVRKTTYSNFPGSFSSIVGGDAPKLISQNKRENAGITAWAQIGVNDILEFSLTGASGINNVNLFIKVQKV